MLKYLIAAIVSVIPTVAVSQTHVDGHYRRDGTYVPPHYRTNPNSTTSDNWTTRGNTNPYTGERGTVDPYRERDRSPTFGSGSSGYGNSLYGTSRRGY